MSTTIDERIVEMQFDNTHFERNVKTTMSTLDKLKEKLRFDGAHKGIDNIKNSIQKIDLSPIGDTVDKVGLKFNALYSMADQWARNMETRLERMAINMAKSLSVDQISAGWEKYESKTASVQALMNSTGKSIVEINKYLDELMWFSDETSYSFSDMIQGLATMASSGGDVEKLIPLIEGVANATSFAGKGAAEFTRVLQYGINQAYSLGYMQLMDWKTLQTATVNSKQLMESLIRAGEELGKIKKGTVTVENFTGTLKDKWLTTEVMEKGFAKWSELSMAAYDAVEAGLYKNATEAIEGLSDKYDELAVKAFKASQEYKSFSEAISATKDAVSSGWMKSFEIIFGNYEEAKQIWTGVGNMLWEVFASGAEKRNNILETALGSKWDTFTKRVEETGLSMEDFMETLKEVAYENGKSVEDIVAENGSLEEAFRNGALSTDLIVKALGKYVDMDYDVSKSSAKMTEKLDKFQKVFDEVWNGDWGNGQERYDRLTAAGYKYAEVQDLVNNHVAGHKFTLEELSDAQLISIGYTEDQIEAIRNLAESAQNADDPLRKLIDDMAGADGRTLLIKSFENIAGAIGELIKPIKLAWAEVFPSTEESKAGSLYDLITAFHDLTTNMTISEDTSLRLKNIFEGMFKGMSVTSTVFSRSLKAGLTILEKVLSLLGTDLVGAAEIVANYIGKFADWLNKYTLFYAPMDKIAKIIRVTIQGLHDMLSAFLGLDGVRKVAIAFFDKLGIGMKNFATTLNLPTIDSLINSLTDMFAKLTQAIKDLDKSDVFNAGADFMAGLLGGLGSGLAKVIEFVFNIGIGMINALRDAIDSHSPSKAAEDIAMDFMIGLWNGLVAMWPDIMDTLKDIGLQMLDILKNISLKDIFVIGSVVGIGKTVNKILKIIDKIVNPLDTLNKVFKEFEGSGQYFKSMFSSIGRAFTSFSDNVSTAITKNLKSKTFLNIAKAIGILSIALIALAYVAKNDGWALANAVVVIWALTAALLVVIKALNKLDGNMVTFASAGFLIGSIAAAILMIALAMKMIGSLGVDGTIGTFIAIAAIILLMKLLLKSIEQISSFNPWSIFAASFIFSALAKAMVIIAIAMKIFGSLSWLEIGKSIVSFIIVGVLITSALKTLAEMGNTTNPAMIQQLGRTFALLAISIGILALAMKVIASMSWSDVIKGIAVIAAVELLFIGLASVSKWDMHTDKAGAMFWKLSASMILLAVAMKIIGTMDVGALTKGLVVIGALELFLGLFVSLTKWKAGAIEEAGKMFWRVGLAMALLAVAMKIIGTMDVGTLTKGLVIIGVLEFFMSKLISVSLEAGEHASKVGTMLMKMSVAILILVGAIALLSILEPTDVAVGVAAVSALMYMFSIVVKSLQGANDVEKSISKITAALALLVGAVVILTLMAKSDPAAMGIAAASITAIIIAFTAVVAASKHLKGADTLWKALTPLIVAIGVIGLILAGFAALEKQHDMRVSVQTAGAISVLLLALAASMAIVGKFGGGANISFGFVGKMLAALAGVAAILGVLAYLDVNPSIESATALSILLLAMSGVTVILGRLGPTVALAAQGALALDAAVVIIGALLIRLGELMAYVPKAEEFLNNGIEVMGKIGEGIGALFGGMVAGAISKGSEGFVTLADNMKKYGDTMNDVDVDAITESAKAVGALVDVAKLIPNSGGLVSIFAGDNDLANFALKLIPLGMALKTYATYASGITEEQIAAITNSAKAIGAIVEVANAIPDGGGLKAGLFGDNDLVDFALKLSPLGIAIKAYSWVVSGITEEQITSIENSAKAIGAIVDVANAIPDSGGWKGVIFGDNDLSAFAESLIPFAKGVIDYAGVVQGLTPEAATAIKNSAEAITAIVEIANAIPDSGGWKAAILGDNDLNTFGFQMTRLAAGIIEYNRTISGGLDIEAIKTSVKAIKEVAKLAEILPTYGGLASLFDGSIDYVGFGSGIVEIGKGVKNYSTTVTGMDVEAVTSSITAINKIVNVVNKMSDIDTSGVWMFKSALTSLSELTIKDFVAGFNTGESDVVTAVTTLMGNAVDAINKTKDAFKTKGKDAVDWTKSGIDDNSQVAVSAMEDVGDDTVDAISSYDADFKDAGKGLVTGFASGIREYTFMAEAQAKAMAAAAALAAKKELDINSPSKVFRRLGFSVPEGFAQGIDMMGRLVNTSTVNMAGAAIDTVRKSISRISDIVSSDIDSQPTIRPVLDLSDISSGVNDMNNMFGMTPSIGVMRNVGSISSMMNRNQNGGNDDVISAIKELGNKFDRTSGDTYQINGVTYDDGSNVSTAVKALVRAAKIERRV